jgi:hypothetical protein
VCWPGWLDAGLAKLIARLYLDESAQVLVIGVSHKLSKNVKFDFELDKPKKPASEQAYRQPANHQSDGSKVRAL